MSEEFNSVPLFTFKTTKNTELGAMAVRETDDGSVVLEGVLKKVTESMLQSYNRSDLGKWTPNRAAIRYTREELNGRDFKRFEGGDALDVDALLALSS